MTDREGYHVGTKIIYELASLPPDWHPKKGLTFPLTISTGNGAKLTFYEYAEYTEFIHQLFIPSSPNIKHNKSTWILNNLRGL